MISGNAFAGISIDGAGASGNLVQGNLIGTNAAGTAGVFSTPAQTSLIADWSGNGNALDSSGNGHNGTLVNGAGFGPGNIGQAFQFNGVNQYVSVPQSNAWAFGNGPFTVGLWADFSAIRQGALGSAPNVFTGADDGAGATNKWIFFYDGKGHLAFHINTFSSGSTFLTPPTTFFPSVGAWNFYAITMSGGTFTFYVNGVSLGTATSSLAIPQVNAPLTIGQAEGLGYFDGGMEQVQIYNQALSPSQVAQLAGSTGNGVALVGASGNTIGGSTAGAGNVISGNSADGVEDHRRGLKRQRGFWQLYRH